MRLLIPAVRRLLLLRPRRFGKTLGMSMLYYFFNAHNADYNRALFNDMQISQDAEAMEHQGKYPTIFLSLKGAKANSYEECIADISAIVQDMYTLHEYLLHSKNLTDDDKKIIHDFLYRKSDITNLKKSIALLSQYLYKHFYPNDNQKIKSMFYWMNMMHLYNMPISAMTIITKSY